MGYMNGLGDIHAQFKVYIANRPNFENYSHLLEVKPISTGEIDAIGQSCGNGWRKVFNVYAKLIFALNLPAVVKLSEYSSWQHYREQSLLQANSNTVLLFNVPSFTNTQDIHIIMGKTYAKTLTLPSKLEWLDNDFAIDKSNKIIVCPYFDYRQLSNIKIVRLVELIRTLNTGKLSP